MIQCRPDAGCDIAQEQWSSHPQLLGKDGPSTDTKPKVAGKPVIIKQLSALVPILQIRSGGDVIFEPSEGHPEEGRIYQSNWTSGNQKLGEKGSVVKHHSDFLADRTISRANWHTVSSVCLSVCDFL